MVLFKFLKLLESEVLYEFFLENDKNMGGVVAFKKKQVEWRFIEQTDSYDSFYTGMIRHGARTLSHVEDYPEKFCEACY